MFIITEILIGSASIISSSTVGLINPGAGVVNSCITALLTSIAVIITNEYNSELKLRYTKLGDWVFVITLLYEKTLEKTSMVDKKSDEKKVRNWKTFIISSSIKKRNYEKHSIQSRRCFW